MPQQAPATQFKHSRRDQPSPETLAEWTLSPLGSTMAPVQVHFAQLRARNVLLLHGKGCLCSSQLQPYYKFACTK